MINFANSVERVLKSEGGLANDSHDSGGLTNFGISQAQYPGTDVANLTREDAIRIYKRDYWDTCGCEDLPPALAFLMFDAAVNHGQPKARFLLQKALGVVQDGIIGKDTIAAAHRDPEATIQEFCALRMYQYGMHPEFMRFGKGWARRLMDVYRIALREI